MKYIFDRQFRSLSRDTGIRKSVNRHCLVACLLCLTGVSACHAQNGKELFVRDRPAYRDLIAAGSGFLIENPEMLVGPGVVRVSLSPDGRYALVLRYKQTVTVAGLEASVEGTREDSVPGESSLTIWDSRDNRTTVVWRERPPAGTSLSLQTHGWFAGSTKAIIGADRRSTDENGKPVFEGSFFVVDAAARMIQQTIAPKDSTSIYPNPSPTQPFAWLASAEGSASDETRFLGADGVITPPIKIPGFMWFTRWSEDGTEMRGYHQVEKPDHTSTDEWYAINPATQTIRSILEPPKNSKGEEDRGEDEISPSSSPFRLIAQPNGLTSPRSSSVWLEANDGSERVLITGDGAPLGVTRFAAFYSMAGALYVASIREIGALALVRLRQGNVRKETVQRATTIGNALVMYTFTHAKLFPDASGDLAKSLKLATGSAVLKDFTYQPAAAQKLTGRNDPTATVLGFITAPGGRATVYSDGSVKWEDAK